MAGNDADSARLKLREALRSFQDFEMHAQELACLEDQADLLQVLGMVDDAVHLYAAVETFRERLALARPPRGKPHWEKNLAAVRSAVGDAEYEALWEDGCTWELDGAIRRALKYLAPHPVTA